MHIAPIDSDLHGSDNRSRRNIPPDLDATCHVHPKNDVWRKQLRVDLDDTSVTFPVDILPLTGHRGGKLHVNRVATTGPQPLAEDALHIRGFSVMVTTPWPMHPGDWNSQILLPNAGHRVSVQATETHNTVVFAVAEGLKAAVGLVVACGQN
jgi:hypothetical protein